MLLTSICVLRVLVMTRQLRRIEHKATDEMSEYDKHFEEKPIKTEYA